MRTHLVSDVPLAARVSGGLDSSAIAALARRGQPGARRRPSPSASTIPRFDESPHARAVARHLGSTLHSVRADARAADRLSELVWHTEVPQLVPGAIGGLLLAERERAEGVPVVLTGDGADELLGGYDVFRAARARRFFERPAMRPFRSAALRAAGRATRQPRGLVDWMLATARPSAEIAAAYGGVVPPWYDVWRLLDVDRAALLSPGGRRVRPVEEPPSGFSALVHPDVASLDPLDAELALELETRLPSWILVISDRTAMAHGVETRVPFLDHPVVELTASIPPGGEDARAPREGRAAGAVRDLLPRAVVARQEAALPHARPRVVLLRRRPRRSSRDELAAGGGPRRRPVRPRGRGAAAPGARPVARATTSTAHAARDGDDARARHPAPAPPVRRRRLRRDLARARRFALRSAGGDPPSARPSPVRLCAVSVDLDEIPNYFAIHGLPEPHGPGGARSSTTWPSIASRELADELAHPAHALRHRQRSRAPEAAAKLARRARGAASRSPTTRSTTATISSASGRDEIRRQIERGGATPSSGPRASARSAFARPATPSPTRSSTVLAELGVALRLVGLPVPGVLGGEGGRHRRSSRCAGGTSRSIVDTPAVLTRADASLPRRPPVLASAATGCSSCRSR